MKNPIVIPAFTILIVSISISCSSHTRVSSLPIIDEVIIQPQDFSGLLKSRATRIDVELAASLGPEYKSRKQQEIDHVSSDLNSIGKFDGYSFGNNIFRVNNIEQAESLLGELYPYKDFEENSKLSRLFNIYHKASIVLLDSDDQRILFFDNNDKFVDAYPKP